MSRWEKVIVGICAVLVVGLILAPLGVVVWKDVLAYEAQR